MLLPATIALGVTDRVDIGEGRRDALTAAVDVRRGRLARHLHLVNLDVFGVDMVLGGGGEGEEEGEQTSEQLHGWAVRLAMCFVNWPPKKGGNILYTAAGSFSFLKGFSFMPGIISQSRRRHTAPQGS